MTKELRALEETCANKSCDKKGHQVVIMISANSLEVDRSRAFQSGADMFIEKPLYEESLVDELEKYMHDDSRRSGAEPVQQGVETVHRALVAARRASKVSQA